MSDRVSILLYLTSHSAHLPVRTTVGVREGKRKVAPPPVIQSLSVTPKSDLKAKARKKRGSGERDLAKKEESGGKSGLTRNRTQG